MIWVETDGTYGTHRTYVTEKVFHFSRLTFHFSPFAPRGANIHLDGGDAFSSGDFFAGVAGKSEEAEQGQHGDYAYDEEGRPEIRDGEVLFTAGV